MKRASGGWLLFFVGVLLLGPPAAVGTEKRVAEKISATEPVLQHAAHGVILSVGDKFLYVEVCAPDVIRVACATNCKFFARESLAAQPLRAARTDWKLIAGPKEAVLSTSKLHIHIALATGAVSFSDTNEQVILAEEPGGRTMTPAIVQGDQTFHVRQEWKPNPGEALYGLGQQQLGLMNLKGYDLDLWQYNGTVAIPFLVSSRGYGILWDNTSFTRFGDLREFEPIPPAQLFGADGKPEGFTASYFTGEHFDHLVAERMQKDIDVKVPADAAAPNLFIDPWLTPTGSVCVRWEGEIQANETGDYLFEIFSDYGVKLWADDHLVISAWHQRWQPWKNMAKVHLETGHRCHLKLDWTTESGGQILRLRWKTPAHDPNNSLWSEVGKGTDYYFCYGPKLDDVVAGYRRITGQATLLPLWAYGLWQSRQRYETAQQSLDVLAGFRSRHIPIDNIVQDWFYWKEDQWGSHQFDPARFPDPRGWAQAIHEKYHAQVMISVWPKFYPGTANYAEMRSHGYLYETDLGEDLKDWMGYPYTFYDAFNPAARKMFWQQIDRSLFVKGVDAWWLDASEPELAPNATVQAQCSHMHPTAMGGGARMLNAYPLMNSAAVYQGQRAAAPDRRVFILTRSAFAGQQRYSAAVWSGDISSTWTAMRAQIPAGLGFCLSGLPYWTMDIGGFSVPARFSAKNPRPEDLAEWRELNARWFEFGTFVPLLRVHGEFPYREPWEFGGDNSPTYQAELKFDRLRYRLLPYIYSLAGNVTVHGGTMMRALVMDFASDTNVLNIGDQYMFGPALLVNPVTVFQARSRPVYLPKADGGWFDFWTGKRLAGGQTIESPAPYDALPIYVRAGSIIPCGPELQYTSELPADPITLFIYAGASGAFTIYEDDGWSNECQKGAYSCIPIRWDDGTKTLTLAKRTGSFKGMLKRRTFDVVLIEGKRADGLLFHLKPDTTLTYTGAETEVKLRLKL
ncbi:MAG TPA: TIM-barrel domain-containing protein [Verrucomicrobiae bacterium]